ncbi:hypothetical protein [Streptomyces sp. NPDC086023]|uniref:hypothetical protein n=1 Tax=Streptomyces sp. NPDC086023 TaxID=3365746 RepID=UPI0037D1A9A8
MTGPEHYREAEQLLALDEHLRENGGDPGDILHAAQVHATLALTAATAMQAAVDGSEPGMGSGEFHEWYQAAGVKPKRAEGDA